MCRPTTVLPPVERTSTNMFALLPDSLSHEYRVSDDRTNIEKICRIFAHRYFRNRHFSKHLAANWKYSGSIACTVPIANLAFRLRRCIRRNRSTPKWLLANSWKGGRLGCWAKVRKPRNRIVPLRLPARIGTQEDLSRRSEQAKRLKALEKKNSRLTRLLADAELDKAILKEATSGNFQARRSGVKRSNPPQMHSGPTGCPNAELAGYVGQPRSTQRPQRRVPSDKPRLIKRITELAREYGRYGYRRVTALL